MNNLKTILIFLQLGVIFILSYFLFNKKKVNETDSQKKELVIAPILTPTLCDSALKYANSYKQFMEQHPGVNLTDESAVVMIDIANLNQVINHAQAAYIAGVFGRGRNSSGKISNNFIMFPVDAQFRRVQVAFPGDGLGDMVDEMYPQQYNLSNPNYDSLFHCISK